MSKTNNFVEYQYDKVPIENNSNSPKYGFGVRHIQLILIGVCVVVTFMARAHMGVTIVAMVDNKGDINESTTLTLGLNNTSELKETRNNTSEREETRNKTSELEEIRNNTSELEETRNDLSLKQMNITLNATTANTTISNADKITTFKWPKSTQEMILGSFFLGYFIMTFPMGMVAQRFGGIIPLQICLFINGFVSFATPWLTTWGGWKTVCACRLLQGLSQAGLFPGIQSLLAKWVPISERAFISSCVYAGTTAGTVIAFPLSGFLAETRWGWPSVFWAIGGICLGTFALLTAIGASSPSTHKSISEAEKNYISGGIDNGNSKRLPTPWKKIISNRHTWANFVTHTASGVAFYFVLVQLPTYIHCILDIDVKSSGILSSLPYVAAILSSIVFGVVSDYVINNGIVSVHNARKTSNSIAQFGMALTFICLSFTTSPIVAVACLVLGMSCNSAAHSGWMVNHIDLAPNFSGTLMAIGNCMMNSCNVLCPVLVSYVVTDVIGVAGCAGVYTIATRLLIYYFSFYNIVQWRIMFFIMAGLICGCNIVFIAFMSADVQPWNFAEEKDETLCPEVQALDDIKKGTEIK